MCFSNFHNRFGSMQVFLDFGVYYEGQTKKEEEAKTKEEHSRDLNSTLSSIVVGKETRPLVGHRPCHQTVVVVCLTSTKHRVVSCSVCEQNALQRDTFRVTSMNFHAQY